MSSRYYPRWVAGNPQLRIFLPDFWMILVKNASKNAPPNRVTFKVSPQMSPYDVRNYLEKIYKLPVVAVNTVVHSGRIIADAEGKDKVKEPDYRLCYVTLPPDVTFKHPGEDLFSGGKKEHGQDAEIRRMKKQIKSEKDKIQKATWSKSILPNWFV